DWSSDVCSSDLFQWRVGRKLGVYCPENKGLVDLSSYFIDGRHQAQHGTAWRFHQYAACTCIHRGVAASTRNQAHLTKELAFTDANAFAGLLVNYDFDGAGDNGVERIGVVITGEHHVSLGRNMYIAFQHYFTETQFVHAGKTGDGALDPVQCCVNIQAKGKRGKFVGQKLVVDRRNRAPENVLDNFVALVHRLLDQRIAGQRANDVKPRDVGFVLVSKLRHGVACSTGKLDAA